MNSIDEISCTAINSGSVGEFNGSHYDGGLGMLQSGQADFFTMFVNTPLKTAFRYSPPVFEEKFYILSAYNMTNMAESKDILYLFDSFSTNLWIAVGVMLLILLSVLVVGRKLLQNINGVYEPIWIISMFSLGQDYLKEINQFLYVFSTTLVFFWFFIIQYLLNTMSTDLVVIQDPNVIQSYQEIISTEYAVPVFMRGFQDHEDFKNGRIGSLERQVWEKGLERVGNQGQKMLVNPIGEFMGEFINPFISNRLVSLQRYSLGMILTLIMVRHREDTRVPITKERLYEDLRIMFKVIENARLFQQAFVASPSVDPATFNLWFRRMRTLVEGGIINRMLVKVMDNYFPLTSSSRSAYSDKIQRNSPPQPNLSIVNMYMTLKLMAYFLLAATLVLLIESLHKMTRFQWKMCQRSKKRRTKKKRKKRKIIRKK